MTHTWYGAVTITAVAASLSPWSQISVVGTSASTSGFTLRSTVAPEVPVMSTFQSARRGGGEIKPHHLPLPYMSFYTCNYVWSDMQFCDKVILAWNMLQNITFFFLFSGWVYKMVFTQKLDKTCLNIFGHEVWRTFSTMLQFLSWFRMLFRFFIYPCSTFVEIHKTHIGMRNLMVLPGSIFSVIPALWNFLELSSFSGTRSTLITFHAVLARAFTFFFFWSGWGHRQHSK